MAIALLVLAVLVAVSIEVLLRRRRPRPATVEGYLRRGKRAFARGQLDQAAECCREAIRLDYSSPPAHYCLATVLFSQGDYDGAIGELNSCLRWGPEYPQIHANLGAAHYRKGDLEAAAAHYRRAVEIAPEHPEFRQPLAGVLWEMGREGEAKEVLPEFEPLSAEERERRERQERAWEQVGERSRGRLRRWRILAQGLRGLLAICAIGVVVCVVAIAVGIAYRSIAHPAGFSLSDFAATMVFAIKVFGAGILLSSVALNLIGRVHDSIVRREMVLSEVAPADVDAAAPERAGPPWWKVELSGAHLALWVLLPLLVYAFREAHDMPDWTVWPAIYLLVLWVVKAGVIASMLLGDWGENDRWLRQYQWFGTARGSAVALVVFPACVGMVMLLVWWVFGLIWG